MNKLTTSTPLGTLGLASGDHCVKFHVEGDGISFEVAASMPAQLSASLAKKTPALFKPGAVPHGGSRTRTMPGSAISMTSTCTAHEAVAGCQSLAGQPGVGILRPATHGKGGQRKGDQGSVTWACIKGWWNSISSQFRPTATNGRTHIKKPL